MRSDILIYMLLLIGAFVMFYYVLNKKTEELEIKINSQKVKPIEYRHDYPFPYEDIPYDYEHHSYPYGLTEFPRPAVTKGALKYTSDKYRRSTYGGLPYVTSLDAELADNLDYHSVKTPWDKVGILSTKDETDNTILLLYKRAIDPYRDFYEYEVEDKHGVIIPLGTQVTYLEDGDIIKSVKGKEGKGEFKVHLFDKDKYVYV